MINPSLAELLHDGVGIHLATSTATFEPEGARALAIQVQEDGEHVDVYMPEVSARRLLPLLEAHGRAAVGVARPLDERACQVKGWFVAARPALESERERVMSQWEGYGANLDHIGIPSVLAERWTTWPCTVIRLRITEVFDQTPGANAGEPLS